MLKHVISVTINSKKKLNLKYRIIIFSVKLSTTEVTLVVPWLYHLKIKFSITNSNSPSYSRVKNGLLPRIRIFREITFFMLCVTRIFKSYFECLRLVTLN
jgi:hypothetical protein